MPNAAPLANGRRGAPLRPPEWEAAERRGGIFPAYVSERSHWPPPVEKKSSPPGGTAITRPSFVT